MGRYHDDWILEHYSPDIGWAKLLREYNETFGTSIKYPVFVSHMNRELGLEQDRRKYTQQEDDFLRAHYSELGYKETARLFNLEFRPRTPRAIQGRCNVLGLCVSEDRLKRMAVENHGRYCETGTIKTGFFREPGIKTEHGWVRVKHTVYEPKRGMVVIHLDGDVNNNSRDNLAQISRKTHGQMVTERFYSSKPEITKAGIIWCRLKQTLEGKGADVEQVNLAE